MVSKIEDDDEEMTDVSVQPSVKKNGIYNKRVTTVTWIVWIIRKCIFISETNSIEKHKYS